jgi:CheY-like chemotaxis protein
VQTASGQLIVVIEDHEDTRELLGEWLGYHGYGVVCATSAAEAESKLGTRAAAVCLVDLRVGEVNGLDIVKQLRRRPACLRMASIVLTALHPNEARRLMQIAEMEGVPMFTKPVDLDLLRATIEEVAPAPSEDPGASANSS